MEPNPGSHALSEGVSSQTESSLPPSCVMFCCKCEATPKDIKWIFMTHEEVLIKLGNGLAYF